MKIYGIEIQINQSPVKVDMRHDWLIRQADDLQVVTDNYFKKLSHTA
jgi:hypothetical protein